MPRPIKLTAKDVQRARRDWYIFHVEKRQKFLAMPPNTQHIYENAAMRVSAPRMTIYGGLEADHPTADEYRALMMVQGMQDIDLANPWYVSDEGWADFQRIWQELPEPVDLYTEGCVQKGRVVHVVHNHEELSPAARS